MKNALLLGLFAVTSYAAMDKELAKKLAQEAANKFATLKKGGQQYLVEESVVVGKNWEHDPLGRPVLDRDTSKKLADEAVKKLPNLHKIGEQARPAVQKETADWQNKKLNHVGEVQRPEVKKETASWQNKALKATGKVLKLVEESVVVGKNWEHDPLGRPVLDRDTSKKLADEAVKKLPNLHKIGEQARPAVQKETADWQNKKLNHVGEVQRPEVKKETASWQTKVLKTTGKVLKLVEESVVVGKNWEHDPLGRAVLDKDTSKKLADEAVKMLPNLNQIGEQARPAVQKETADWQNKKLNHVGEVQRPEIKKETASWQNMQLKPVVKLTEESRFGAYVQKAKETVVGAVKNGIEKVKSTITTVKEKIAGKKEELKQKRAAKKNKKQTQVAQPAEQPVENTEAQL